MVKVNEYEELTHFLYGGAAEYKRLQSVWRLVEADEAFSKSTRAYMNHSQRYVDSLRKVKRFQEICDELMPDDESWSLEKAYEIYLALDENTPLDVHLSMFIPVLQHHTSSEQRQRWLPKAQRFRIIGAYAQTELGHGSNVRSLETTSTFDVNTDEWVVHSPSLSSTKFWPGGLGHTCTHAIVYARLIIRGHDLGVHPFMVPLRCPSTHRPLPGVRCGDIGPKLGYNAMDNGYARFHHVRIPRTNMLQGFAHVDRHGTYSKSPGAEKLQGGIMLSVRARIVKNSAYVLGRAVTIAVRYSQVRHQGSAMSVELNHVQEHPVMRYPQQRKLLFPLLAYTYAVHCTGTDCWRMYARYLADPTNMGVLAELHNTTSCLKATVTHAVCAGMETCRAACGGHGFLSSSGFQELMMSYLPMKTLEGTREVLLLQTGKWLVALAGQQLSTFGPRPFLPPTAQYLSHLAPSLSSLLWGRRALGTPVNLSSELARLKSFEDDTTVAFAVSSGAALATTLLGAFEKRALHTIIEATTALHRTSTDLEAHIDDGDSIKRGTKASRTQARAMREKAVSTQGVKLSEAAEAHAELLIVRALHQSACGGAGLAATLGATDRIALQRLLLLLLMTFIEKSLGDFLAADCFGNAIEARRGLDALTGRLLDELEPHARALVDAFSFSDQRLDSTLGRADGRVYEGIFEATQREPLNRKEVGEGYYRYLRDVLSKPMPDPGAPAPMRARL